MILAGVSWQIQTGTRRRAATTAHGLTMYEKLNITQADVVAGSMGGWIAMNHAIYAPDRVRRLVLLGPMGLPPWRATLAVLVPFAWYLMRPTEAKFDRIIFRSLGEGGRVNREFRPWMRIVGKGKARVGQPIHIPQAGIKSPT